jgi:hypothetical protein
LAACPFEGIVSLQGPLHRCHDISQSLPPYQ